MQPLTTGAELGMQKGLKKMMLKLQLFIIDSLIDNYMIYT